MPTINFTKNSALDFSASAQDQNATLNRYLQNAITFAENPNFSALVDQPLRSVSGFSSAALNAAGTASFAVAGATLCVQPGLSATLGLLRGDGQSDFLHSLQLPDTFSPAGLVSFALKGSVTLKDSGSVNNFALGIAAGETVTLTAYHAPAAAATVKDAVINSAASLTIPRDLADLESLPVGSACQLDATSSLKFSASVSWSLFNSALATVPIAKLPSISVSAKAGATISGAACHTAAHTVTIARISDRILHLAVNLSASEELSSGLTVSAGLTADLGSKDALGFLLDKIGLHAGDEMKQIREEIPAKGMELSADIKGAIEGALSDCLEVSLKAAVDRTASRKSLFLYEIDLQALNESAKSALLDALAGDFTGITAQSAPLAGIRELSSSLTEALKDTHSLGIHLLGIFNYASANQFLRTAKFSLAAGKRDLVLSDNTTEVNTNALADEKLRELVLKGATLTLPAAANGTGLPGDASLNLVFFDHEGAASRAKLSEFVNVLRAISAAADAAAAGSALQSATRGVCSLYLGLNISASQCRRLFASEDPLFYLGQIRSAQATILNGTADSEPRLRLFSESDSVWSQLVEAGSEPNIVLTLKNAGFGDHPEALVTDVLTAVWWSKSMALYAKALNRNEPLEKAGTGIVKSANLGFNEPWLILACWSMLQNPPLDVRFTSPGRDKVLTAKSN